MQMLDQKYMDQLEGLAGEIQASDELQLYLEEEEEEYYMRLKEAFEPNIAELYEEVAAKDPLQLISFETILLDEAFEGLYLPKILGYSVLRGETNEDFKYVRPQDHFKDVLMAICNSANFDILKKRIGQSIQTGFALSSDIWVTNLINSFENKRIRYYLQGHKLEKYRIEAERRSGYKRYQRQFASENFQTAKFPEDVGELKTFFSPLKNFLIHRIRTKADNSSLMDPLKQFIENKELHGHEEHLQTMGLFGGFFELNEEQRKHLATHFNKIRKTTPEFDAQFLSFVMELHNREDIELNPEAEKNLSAIVDKSIKDELSGFYTLTDMIHAKGYNTDEVQEAVKNFYNRHQGLSLVNECVRQTIYQYFARFINNLEEKEYPEFFEISKLFPVYIGIFANQQFNQDIKELCMNYVSLLLKRYTDKRGKDYQDIKKFVSTTFVDLAFLKEKEIVELFKTRRKRKKTA